MRSPRRERSPAPALQVARALSVAAGVILIATEPAVAFGWGLLVVGGALSAELAATRRPPGGSRRRR
jgi:hypothetical protein